MKDIQLALYALGSVRPDVVLLDWTVTPPMTTQEFVERYSGLFPVLVLTRHAVLMDTVYTLRAGAADFIRQPCFMPEIVARVERAQTASPVRQRISQGRISLDVGSGIAKIGEHSLHLNGREARILAALLCCPDHPVSRDSLMRTAGINRAKPTIIESYIKQLRKKHAYLRRALRTRYGRGYAYCPEAEA